MSQSLEEMKVEHEKMKLEKRKVDRETEDTRAKEIDHKRKNANEIEDLEKAVEDKKELVASLNEKNKVRDKIEILLTLSGFIFNSLGALRTFAYALKLPKTTLRYRILGSRHQPITT